MNLPLRSLILAASLLAVLGVSAQRDTSLTRDFELLSAKERSRIAKKELVESTNDVDYQAVMAEADELFRQQRYDESLERFRIARTMRPYNVYPKVKIQDLTALIAKRDEVRTTPKDTSSSGSLILEPITLPEPQADPEPSSETTAPVTVIRDPEPRSEPVIKVPDPEVKTPDRTVREPDPRPRKDRVPEERSRRSPGLVGPPPSETNAPDGTSERIYKEGRAVVRERTVVSEGKIIVYRQVTHPWGETVHFKDGIAVPSRTWEEAFPE